MWEIVIFIIVFFQGSLVGWQGDLIHTFNKNESAIHKSDYFEKIVHRDNVILMGDTIGDLRMADGCAKDANILKIGFLNDKVGFLGLNIFYSGIKDTEKDWVRLKVQHHPLSYFIQV